MSGENRKRLAQAVIARRTELGMKTTKALADAAHLTPRMLGDVENGRRDNYSPGAKAQIEHALNWAYGSIDDVLGGGEATPVRDLTDTTTPGEYLAKRDFGQQSLHDLITTYGSSRDKSPGERADIMLAALRRAVHAVRQILIHDSDRTVRANAIDALNPADAAITFVQQDLEEMKGTRHELEVAPPAGASTEAGQAQEVGSGGDDAEAVRSPTPDHDPPDSDLGSGEPSNVGEAGRSDTAEQIHDRFRRSVRAKAGEHPPRLPE